MSASHDTRAVALAASVPEKSRDFEIQRARLKAEELYELVSKTASHTKPTQTIAGMLREFALEYWEKEKESLYREVEVRMRAEARQMMQEMQKANDGYERILSGLSLLPYRSKRCECGATQTHIRGCPLHYEST